MPRYRRTRRSLAAMRTRSPRWRAGTRANKRTRIVPTFASDREAATR